MRGHTLKISNIWFVDCAFHLQTVPKARGSFCEREQISKEIDYGSSTRNSKRKWFLLATATLSRPCSSLCNVRHGVNLLDRAVYFVSLRSELDPDCMRKNSHVNSDMDEEISLYNVNSLEKQKIKLLKYSPK